MHYSDYKNLIIKKEDKVAIVTMNRPESLNAVSYEMHKELVRVFADLRDDDDVSVAILTGAGKAFCAGGDIGWFKKRAENPEANPMISPHEPIDLLTNMLNLPKPLIAAVNGGAIGIGASLAFFSDIIIAAENARFADMHVNIGLVAGDGCAAILPMLMGVAKAKEYLLTGDFLSAQEAEKLGVINRVVPQDKLMSEAMAFAQRLASGPPLAIMYTKLAVNRALIDRMNMVIPYAAASEFLCFQSRDHVEAINAFLEKRAPKFIGK